MEISFDILYFKCEISIIDDKAMIAKYRYYYTCILQYLEKSRCHHVCILYIYIYNSTFLQIIFSISKENVDIFI